jgi:hypothetical protein
MADNDNKQNNQQGGNNNQQGGGKGNKEEFKIAGALEELERVRPYLQKDCYELRTARLHELLDRMKKQRSTDILAPDEQFIIMEDE